MPEELTEQEKIEFQNYLGMNYPQQEEKVGIFHFFNKILGLSDTSKAGNLDIEELNAVRSLQRAKLYNEAMNDPKMTVDSYLQKRAEIVLSTSLSKDMGLIKAAITTKKETKASIKTGEGKKSSWLNKNKKEE